MKVIYISLFTILLFVFNAHQSLSQNYIWGHAFSTPNNDLEIKGIVSDNLNCVYVVGTLSDSVDFDPSIANAWVVPPALSSGMFISKYDSAGFFIWAKFIEHATGKSMCVNDSGLYITGTFNSITDFDPSASLFNLTPDGSKDIFILSLDSSGNFKWAIALNGPGLDDPNAIEADQLGNTYITGYFSDSVDFDPDVSVSRLVTDTIGTIDIFVAKYNNSGNYLWAHGFGGKYTDIAYDLALSNNGIIIVGNFTQDSIDFDPGSGVSILNAEKTDILIASYDQSGNYIWAAGLKGSSNSPRGYSVDFKNNLISIVGTLSDSVDFDPSNGTAFISVAQGLACYVAKYDDNGNYIWAKNIVSSLGFISIGKSVAIDNSGEIYFSGFFNGISDFDPNFGAANLTAIGTDDVFFAKYDSYGNYLWAKNIGGNFDDEATSIKLAPNGNSIFLTGFFTNSIDLDPGPGNATYTFQTGNESIFLAKYSNTVTNIFNEQANENITLSAYPNPSIETITIKTGQGTFIARSTLKIANTLGETVYQKQIVNTQTPIQLDVSFLKAGFYVVGVNTEKGSGYARFMKVE